MPRSPTSPDNRKISFAPWMKWICSSDEYTAEAVVCIESLIAMSALISSEDVDASAITMPASITADIDVRIMVVLLVSIVLSQFKAGLRIIVKSPIIEQDAIIAIRTLQYDRS